LRAGIVLLCSLPVTAAVLAPLVMKAAEFTEFGRLTKDGFSAAQPRQGPGFCLLSRMVTSLVCQLAVATSRSLSPSKSARAILNGVRPTVNDCGLPNLPLPKLISTLIVLPPGLLLLG